MDIKNKAELKPAMNSQVVIFGTLERVDIGKGGKSWKGTAIVLDDGAIIYVTYGAPPEGWQPLLGKYVRAEGALANQSSLTQQSLSAPHLKPASVPRVQPRDWKSYFRGPVTLRGVAQDAKGGAVLLIEDRPIYVKDKASWPAELRGTGVSLTGVLRDEPFLPASTRDANGAISQGTTGDGTELTLELSKE